MEILQGTKQTVKGRTRSSDNLIVTTNFKRVGSDSAACRKSIGS